MRSSTSELEVLILAPSGKDGALASEILKKYAIESTAFKNLEDFIFALKNPSGAILISEEALSEDKIDKFKESLSRQEAWSSLPIILLTSQKERTFSTEKILDILKNHVTISVLERPFKIVTLLAAVRVALQIRERQYQIRGLLRDQEAAVKQRENFLSMASHELKTPLTSLLLQVQMRKRFLKHGTKDVITLESTNALIETVEAQVKRLTRLVDDMLDISRIVNGKLALSPEHMDLGKLVNQILTNFYPQFQNAGCEVTTEIQEGVYGSWDSSRIDQVVLNLFSNAVKYGGGAPISVKVKIHQEKAILIVEDRGMGIAGENLGKLFQRFERVSPKDGIAGLGLGLFITKEIVEAHKGIIRIESEVGKGSKFIVELPVMEESGHVL